MIAPGTTRKAARTRARLIEAARRVLIDQGGSAEIGDITGEAGVSAGLAHHYFGSKSGLITAVLEAFYADYEAVMNRRYPGDNWQQRERARTRAVVGFVLDEPFAAVAFGALALSGEAALAEARCLNGLISLGARNIAGGQASGEISAGLDPELAAAFVLGGTRQLLATALTTSAAPDAEAITETIWAHIAGALGLAGDGR
ncbi:MAG: TetR/AcrR family transcriptional regulator [Pseudomonadota bacterium]